MIEVKVLNGKLNKDSDLYRMPSNDFTDALNITRNNTEIVYNLEGNQVVVNPYLSWSGINKRIGSYADKTRNRIYSFIWNSEGYHLICYYQAGSNTFYKLLQSKIDSDGVDILAWNPSYRINHIDIIYRDEGDLIFWTEGYVRPMFINETDARNSIYGTSWKLEYLTVNRPMPLVPAVGTYANDTDYNINNLFKKVYEFRYRWVYRNFEKSAWSPYSKIPCPIDPDSIAIETDPTKNNRLDIRITTGEADVEKIEIAGRQVISDNLFSDDFLIVSIDKSELAIGNNTNYSYSFFNESTYPTVPTLESLLLFSAVPRKAYTQAMGNGNIPIYGATTESYNKEISMLVTSTITTYDNADAAGLSYTDILNTGFYYFYLLGTPSVGDSVSVFVLDWDGISDDYDYTAVALDTATTMRDALLAQIVPPFYADAVNDPSGNPGIRISEIGGIGLGIVLGTTTITYSGTPVVPPGEIGSSCYRPNSRYKFGIVYFDEYGENTGVNTSSEMSIITAEVDTTGQSEPKITAVNFSIFNQPPSWAKSYCFVRTKNATAQSNLYVVSADTKKDTAGTPVYGYLNIRNQQNNTDGLPVYSFTAGVNISIHQCSNPAVPQLDISEV